MVMIVIKTREGVVFSKRFGLYFELCFLGRGKSRIRSFNETPHVQYIGHFLHDVGTNFTADKLALAVFLILKPMCCRLI